MNDSIYVHIPFCASKCGYCAFYSAPAGDEVYDGYVKALINQIKNTERRPESEIKSVFFGGGTPSVLGSGRLYSILEALDEKFGISSAERTTELNPDSVEDLLSEGDLPLFFNRFSMGAQSFCDEELLLLGRRHDSESAKRAFYRLRDFGAENINIDIMLALPHENHEKKLEKTLGTLRELSPEHVSAYILTVESGTPFAKKYVSDEDLGERCYFKVCDFLSDCGYEHYEISNFAKPDKRCDHNMGYWTQRPYYAFGPQACGFDGKNRFRNDCTTTEFIEKNGIIAPKIEETLSQKALADEKNMLALRLSDGTDSDIFTENNKKFIEMLLRKGFAKMNKNGGISLTDRGFLVSNTIITQLLG